MRISDWSSDVCSSDLEITVIGVGRQQRLMREPYFARTEAAARQRQHRMMREAQRIFDGLALIGHAIQQDLEAHEMPIADAVILDLDPHDRAVPLQMTRAVAVVLADRRRLSHRHFQRYALCDAALA